MVIEIILSVIVTLAFGFMVLRERAATEISAETNSRETPHFLHRADTLLGLCVVGCNAIIWLPSLWR